MGHFVTASMLILTGICAYASVNHAFIAFQRPFSRVHLLFAIMCMLLVGFELFHVFIYTAETLTEFVPLLKWEITFIALFFMVFPWFISEYGGVGPRWMLIVLTALAVVALVINVVRPYSIQYAELSRLDRMQLPWGETISQPIGQNTPGFFIVVLFVFIIFSYAVYTLGLRYYRDRLATTLTMLVAIAVFVATGVEGALVRMSAINFIHLGPFGILAMIIAMSMALSREMQLKIRASENRYRSLVEQSPFSMQVLSSEGNTLQVNPAWENLWGVTADKIINYNPLQDQQLKDIGITPYLEQGFTGNATEIPPSKYDPAKNPLFEGPHNERWVRAFVYPIKDETGAVHEVVLLHEDVTSKKRFEDAVHLIATGVSKAGEGFFQQLVKSLSELFGTQYAFVGVLESPELTQVKTIAVSANGKQVPNIVYDLVGTPCANVIGRRTCIYPRDVQSLFPEDRLLADMGAEGYLGTPLFDVNGAPQGIIVLLDSQPLHDVEQMKAIMEIVAARTAAELERSKADDLLRQQRRHLQEMVDNRTAELQNALKELEAFSYSVSHDLRAPLRSIDGFSQALVEDYYDMLDKQGKDYLDRIRNNAQRMALLIDNLMQLSRVTRKDMSKQPVNLSGLVKDSLKKYQEQDPLRTVDTKIPADIIVNGDADLLAIVIDNLVSNAWKYTNKTEHAVIEFGARRDDGKVSYFIKDNGAGFDMKYADKIFGPFQRLHPSEEFEGSGVGLATVSRIILRHGGKLWAEAKPNSGAVFYFTLPDAA